MLQLGAISKKAGSGAILSTHEASRKAWRLEGLTGWKDALEKNWNGECSNVLRLGQDISLVKIQDGHRLPMIVRSRK